MKYFTTFLILVLGIFVGASSISLAAVPQLTNYQARLMNNLGTPLDTVASIVFRICSDSLGVTELWSETHPNVVVQKGLFQVLLGSVNPLAESVFDGSKRWLSVQLQGASAGPGCS